MKQIIDGLSYDMDTADLVAHDRYWDGSNFERSGRNSYLFRTKNGRFFLQHTTCWQGERDSLEALGTEATKEKYERLPEHEMDYAAAFGEEPIEA